MTVRVVLVDDHDLLRQGLAALLKGAGDIELVGQVGSGAEALQLVDRVRPDVVLMDVVMREMNGMEATRQIVARHPKTRVIALSGYADPRFVSGMLCSGARGYLLKANAYDELRRAVLTVATGKTYMCVDSAAAAIPASSKPPVPLTVYTLLGPREREVLQMIAEGCSSIEIAGRLHLSPATIETHRRNLMRKLDLHNVADLTRYAIREGLTTVDV